MSLPPHPPHVSFSPTPLLDRTLRPAVLLLFVLSTSPVSSSFLVTSSADKLNPNLVSSSFWSKLTSSQTKPEEAGPGSQARAAMAVGYAGRDIWDQRDQASSERESSERESPGLMPAAADTPRIFQGPESQDSAAPVPNASSSPAATSPAALAWSLPVTVHVSCNKPTEDCSCPGLHVSLSKSTRGDPLQNWNPGSLAVICRSSSSPSDLRRQSTPRTSERDSNDLPIERSSWSEKGAPSSSPTTPRQPRALISGGVYCVRLVLSYTPVTRLILVGVCGWSLGRSWGLQSNGIIQYLCAILLTSLRHMLMWSMLVC